jgi:hypothetical protein
MGIKPNPNATAVTVRRIAFSIGASNSIALLLRSPQRLPRLMRSRLLANRETKI